jgi:hypothetical protein
VFTTPLSHGLPTRDVETPGRRFAILSPMARRRRSASALLISGAVLLIAVTGCVPAAPSSDSATSAASREPLSLIVQVSSLAPTHSPETVAAWIEKACAPSGDLVLQDIANADGVLASAYLDAIAPYLPGGERACFERVFVGTVDLAWTGSGSKYVEGAQDAAFRQRYLALSQSVASSFVSRYPTLDIDWYITYEANLNDFYYPSIAGAYRSMLSSEMQMLTSIRAGAFAWSPAFWYPHSAYSSNAAGMAQLRANLIDLFSSLQRTAGGIQLLTLQDYVAGSGCQPASNQVTPSDAASWARFLADLGMLPEVTMNIEQYRTDCATGSNGPGDRHELADRRAFYESQSVSIGPSFEIRYWAQTQ